MAGEELIQGLNNLPIFAGVPDDERRRALLTTGLSLMQPRNPVTGGGSLGGISDAITAGLTQLDQGVATRQSVEQQETENVLAGRAADTADVRAEAAVTGAEASATGAAATAQNADTQQAAQVAQVQQFENQADSRAAATDLKKAQAEWLRRRYAGGPAGNQAALTVANQIDARTQELLRTSPSKYLLPDGSVNEALALIDAYEDLNLSDEIFKNESLGIILQNAKEGEDVRASLQGLQSNIAGDNTGLGGGNIPTISTSKERESIPIGGEYIFNGQRYRKQ